MKITILILLSLISCATDERIDRRTTKAKQSPEQIKLEQLEDKFLKLLGTITQINNFTTNDFADCTTSLSTFETKICDIAQAATIEQQIEFSSQLGEMSKLYQNTLYGEDCVNDVDIGCPVVGSISERLTTAEGDIAIIDITAIESDITQLQSDVSALNTRLDNFDGSGQSIETVITTINNDIVLIEARLDAIEGILNSDRIPILINLCYNIANSGPVYEASFLSGNRTRFNAWVSVGGDSGLGIIKEYNDGQGNVYTKTELNTRRCKFKIYEILSFSDLKICWNNSNRNSNESSIDSECDYVNNFLTPSTNCTCL